MQVELSAPRYSLEQTAEGLRVTIPARRNWFVLLFLLVWCAGWLFGEISAGNQLIHYSVRNEPERLFLAVWLLAWTAGGAFAIAAVVWQLAGREVIALDSATLSHRVEAFGVGRTRAFRVTDVRRLRATEWSNSPFSNQRTWFPPVFGGGYGPLAFDYGARTFRIAPGLDEAEANTLVKELKDRIPRSVGSE
jgi:hypothetical protein